MMSIVFSFVMVSNYSVAALQTETASRSERDQGELDEGDLNRVGDQPNPPSKSAPKPPRRFVISGDRVLGNQLLMRELRLLASHAPTRTEIDLLDYQSDQISELNRDLQQAMTRIGRTAGITADERAREMQNQYDEIDHRLDDALMPEQRQRLKQLTFQSFGVASGQQVLPIVNLLGNKNFRTYLGISSTTAERMRTKMQEENEKIAQEIVRLREQANLCVLEVLSKPEREKLTEMLGEPFEFGHLEQMANGSYRDPNDK